MSIRSSEDNSSILGSVTGLLQNDGTIIGIVGNNLEFDNSVSVPDSIYITVYHRNHLGLITKQRVGKDEGLFLFDFSSDVNQLYDGNLSIKTLDSGILGMIG